MSSKRIRYRCALCGYYISARPGPYLHQFPTYSERRTIWLEACGLTDGDYNPDLRICSNHFKQKCFNNTGVQITLKRRSVPTKGLKKRMKVPESSNGGDGCESGKDANKEAVVSQIVSSDKKSSRPKSKDDNKETVVSQTVSSDKKSLGPKSKDDNKEAVVSQIVSSDKKSTRPKSKDDNKEAVVSQIVSSDKKSTRPKSKDDTKKALITGTTSSDKKSLRPKSINDNKEAVATQTASSENKSFCPNTMVRYNLINHPTVWLCQLCLKYELSEESVKNHVDICEGVHM